MPPPHKKRIRGCVNKPQCVGNKKKIDEGTADKDRAIAKAKRKMQVQKQQPPGETKRGIRYEG